MSENGPASLKGWLKYQPCQLVIITMRYHSGRGGSLIKELDLESQMESQVRGLLSDLKESLPHSWWWMSLGNTHPLSTQSSATCESLGNQHPADSEIETKTWGENAHPSPETQTSLVQEASWASPFSLFTRWHQWAAKVEKPLKRFLRQYPPLCGRFNWKPVCCGIVNLLALSEQNRVII